MRRHIVERLAWWTFSAALLTAAAVVPLGCTHGEPEATAVAGQWPAAPSEGTHADDLTITEISNLTDTPARPVATAATPVENIETAVVDTALTPAAVSSVSPTAAAGQRRPEPPPFVSLTSRNDVTDLLVVSDLVLASSTGGLDAWTLEGEPVFAWGAEDGLPGNALVDLAVVDDQLRAAGPGGLAVLAVDALIASDRASPPPPLTPVIAAEGAALPHLLTAEESARPLATAVLQLPSGRAVGTFGGDVLLEGARFDADTAVVNGERHRVWSVGGVVLHLAAFGDALYAVSTQGVHRWVDERGPTVVDNADLTSAAAAEAGGLLLGHADGRIVELTVEGERRQRRSARGKPVTALAEHRGVLFFAVEGEGVTRVGRRRAALRSARAQSSCFNHVGALARWQGQVMVGGFDGGLCALDGRGVPSRRWRAPSRLPSDVILSLGVDDDTLWVGTSYGVATLKPRPGHRRPHMRAYRPSFKNRFELSGYGIVGVARSDDSLWVADGRGVSQIARAKARGVVRHRALPGLPEGLTDVAAAGDRVWVATERAGVSEWTSGAWRAHGVAEGLAEAWVTRVAVADDGRVWAGHSLRGISRYDGARWSVVDTRHGLPDSAIVALAYDAALDLLWAGTLGGLAVLDGESGEVLGAWRSTHGLPDPRAHALLIDGEALWVGTEGGLGYVADRAALVASVDDV